MKKLFFRAVVFALPILCFLAYLEISLRKLPNGYTVKRTRLECVLDDTEVLIIGSSTAFWGIQPSALSAHAFSTAYVAQDIYHDVRLTQMYLDRMPKLHTVIIPLVYISFEYRLDTGSESWRDPFYVHAFGIPNRAHPFDAGNFSYLALYGPDQARKLLINGAPAPDVGPDGGEIHGGLPQGPSDAQAAQVALDRHHALMHPEFAAENIRLTEELLTALGNRGIRAVFVSSPVSSAYSSGMRPDVYRRMQDTTAALCRRYRLQYFNHTFDSDFTEADFYDADHLDKDGATKFTQMLRKEIFKEDSGVRASILSKPASPQSN
jgi:hypothetical protein